MSGLRPRLKRAMSVSVYVSEVDAAERSKTKQATRLSTNTLVIILHFNWKLILLLQMSIPQSTMLFPNKIYGSFGLTPKVLAKMPLH